MELLKLISFYKNRTKSALTVTLKCLNEIKNFNHLNNSVLHINKDAIDQAKKVDEHLSRTNKLFGKFHGIPVLVKGNICSNDQMPTSCGSILLKDYYADNDADIILKLKKEGAIILGKTNMSEFSNYVSNKAKSGYSSLGGSTISFFGKNHPVGGSSSGSAVAVARSFCCFSVGTETDGSVVYPASLNGVYGFKLNKKKYLNGIIGISNFFDCLGFFSSDLKSMIYINNVLFDINQSSDVLISNVFIEEKSFTNSKMGKIILNHVKKFLEISKIKFSNEDFIELINPYFDSMDIICQKEFKNEIHQKMPFNIEEFLDKVRKELLKAHYSDIEEIESSIFSDHDVNQKYQNSIKNIQNLRNSDKDKIQKLNTNIILALTTEIPDISSIATLLNLEHLTIPISVNKDELPIGFSIMSSEENTQFLFSFAKKLQLYLKNHPLC